MDRASTQLRLKADWYREASVEGTCVSKADVLYWATHVTEKYENDIEAALAALQTKLDRANAVIGDYALREDQLKQKLADDKEVQFTEEEMGLLIRRVLADYRQLDEDEASRRQFPRSELLGVEWFREIIAEKSAEMESTEPDHEAESRADCAEAKLATANTRIAELELRAALDEKAVLAIARAAVLAYSRMPDSIMGKPPFITAIKDGTDAAVAAWEKHKQEREQPAEPEPMRCKCGACERDHPKSTLHWSYQRKAPDRPDITMVMMDGEHCPKCGQELYDTTV